MRVGFGEAERVNRVAESVETQTYFVEMAFIKLLVILSGSVRAEQ